MTQQTTGRPLQPSTRTLFARFLAGLDPRCESPTHEIIGQGGVCPRCRRSLNDYLSMVPEVWGA